VAPADVHIVAAGKEEEIFQTAEDLAKEFEITGKTVILDDRKVSPGIKFADAELIGVPKVIIVGRGLANGEVDVWDRRSGERRSVPLELALLQL
jgi:prolyl-tRNA synthetase